MILLIIIKTLIDDIQGLRCTPEDRAEADNDCEWEAFSPFIAYSSTRNEGLWFADGANQCASSGVKVYYSPATNPEVNEVVSAAVDYMSSKTAAASSSSPSLLFTAIGVANVSAIPVADLIFPLEGCTYFVDFTATCTETSTASCKPWNFIVRPSFVPGGYNDESAWEDQRSWFTEIDAACFDPALSLGARGRRSDFAGNTMQFGAEPGYVNHLFLTVQHGVTMALTNSSTLDSLFLSTAAKEAAFDWLNSMTVQRMSYPEYYQSIWAVVLPSFFAFIALWFSSIAVIVALVADMVIEKEQKLTISMKLMGLSSSDWRSSWMKRGIIGYMPVLFAVSILGLVKSVVPASFFLSFVFLIAFGLATLSFSFLVNISRSAQGAICLLAPSCMGIGVEIFATAAYTSSDATWSNAAESDVGGNISMLAVIIMLFFDAAWMYLLAIYIENVRPGEFGTPASPLYPLYYLFPSMSASDVSVALGRESLVTVRTRIEDAVVEERESGNTYGIEIDHLTKTYPPRTVGGNSFTAVRDLTLKMKVNEVTALLGQNGAGKSSTMNMLCGLFSATSGDMKMLGHDIQTVNGANFRRTVAGICPQHDTLWGNLTTYEHLVFFASIKGMSLTDAKAAATTMLEELALIEKRDTFTTSLSGGQKRRLSVAIAMIGGSSVVILDEPTSGVDPQSARQIWEIIERNKDGRTILLSTHSMEEADVLADRIAIIADGNLVCDGSAMFLKRAYGFGYTLTIAKDDGCDSEAIAGSVINNIPGAEVTTDIGSELQIKLPRSEATRFPDALRALEMKQSELKFDSMGISVTTLEEVFLRAVLHNVEGPVLEEDTTQYADDENLQKLSVDDSRVVAAAGASAEEVSIEMPPKAARSSRPWGDTERHVVTAHVPATFRSQVSSVAKKNVMVARRNPMFFALLIVVPIIFMAFGGLYEPPQTEFDPLAAAPPRRFSPDGTILLQSNSSADCTSGLCEYAKETYFPNAAVPTQVVSTITSFVYSIASGDVADFNEDYRLGLVFDDATNSLTAMFNGQYYHTAAVSLRTASAIVLANATTSGYDDLSVTNFPMPKTARQTRTAGQQPSQTAGLWAEMNRFAQAIFTGLLVFRPIKERTANAKLMQLVSGASFRSYWAGFFVVDYSLSVVMALMPVLILCTPKNAPVRPELAGPLFLLNLLFYLAALPMVYIVSCLLSTAAYGFSALFLAQYLLSLVPTTFSSTCAVDPGSWACDAEEAFYFVPIFALSKGQNQLFIQTTRRSSARELAATTAACDSESSCCQIVECGEVFGWDDPGMGKAVLSLVVVGIAFWIILAVIEMNRRGLSYFETAPGEPTDVGEIIDPDVQAEEHRVLHEDTDRIVVRKLRKSFGTKRAVDGISFGVPPKTCFGLLGVNGAGKTTTFKMITGEHRIGSGSVTVAGFDVATDLAEVQRRIGYVPQFDALVGDLTGTELLTFYARLRGIAPDDVPEIVESLIDKLDLRKHCSRICSTYSGGNKRKLSVATALIGDPDILLLDEPTTGMDPGGKRYLWNVVLGLVAQGRSIVLTSHSMEECEALCTKLTIMVDGTMRCFGSVQHLKSEHGSGYIIRVAVPLDNNMEDHTPDNSSAVMDAAVAQVKNALQGSVLKDVYGNKATFHLNDPRFLISTLFEALEKLKEASVIAEYAVGQSSLESIFRGFAQRADEQQRVTATRTASVRSTTSI